MKTVAGFLPGSSMPVRQRFTAITIKELLIVLLAVGIFLLTVAVGGLGGLQISKRQFEAEAQNIAAVLRSGIGVADGVVTSLDASDRGDEQRSNAQLNSHLTSVLGNYEYISGLGKFEGVSQDQLSALEARLAADEAGVSNVWVRDATGAQVNASDVSPKQHYFPLTRFKSRFDSKQENASGLTGFDLASSATTYKALSSLGRTVITAVPDGLQRAGELLVLRSNRSHGEIIQGYLLELDLDEMAAAGGVEIKDFAIDLSMFSEQGEFASASASEQLYHQTAKTTKDVMFSSLFNDNRWLKSFPVGDKTLVLELSSTTGLHGTLVAALLVTGTLLLVMFLTIVQLIRKRRHAQRLQRSESEKLYRARYRAAVTLASIDDGVLTTDAANNVLSANEAAEKLLGRSEADMQGKDIDSVVVHGEEDNSLTLRSADGEKRYVNKKESPLKDIKGELSGHVLVLRDVSVEHSLTKELQHKVNHDSLTGLSNRLHFEAQVHQLFDASSTSEDGHVLCFVDLDRFKEVNDTCGHDAGDELLKRIAQVFSSNVREDDLVARLGGDEFGIVLRNCPRASALQVTSRIQDYFQSFFFEYDGHIFPVRCSIGFVHFQPQCSEPDDVLKTADAACFDAKHLGRNSVCERAVGDNTKKSDQGSKWLPRLTAALENEQFELLVQSMVSLTDSTMTVHEVLLRLVDDDGSKISPNVFMKSAVRYELAERIDRWVVKTTLTNMTAMHLDFSQHKFVVNLSSQSIESAEFPIFLREQIHLAGVDPSRLCFDIKEGDLLSNPTGSEEFCRALRVIGCEVALDDFGAAMTSLALLKSLPITALKIDGSLIRNLGDSSKTASEFNADHALVKSIHSFAATMGLATIAEQVEDEDCLLVLKGLNVDYAQGSAVEVEKPLSAFLQGGCDAAANQRAA